MFNLGKASFLAAGLAAALGTQASVSQAGICSAARSPWNALYTCTRHGTIDTRNSCSPAFPGGAPICVPRLSVMKNSGISTEGIGLDAAGVGVPGCRGFDSNADGVAVIRGAECSRARAVTYTVRF